jgi:acetylornithine/N-succinyldiaminopimelate aminotransferase
MTLDISPEQKTLDRGVLMPITRRPDLVMVAGDGSFVWDDRGRRYLDFVQGWAVNALGHCAPEVQAALRAQAAKLMTASPAYDNPHELELARRLVDLTGLAQAHFASSGAEANEVALKVARKWGRLERGGAFDIVTTHDAFHGRTLAAMAASGKSGWDALFPPNLPGFRKVAHGDIEAMRAAIDERVAAILVEPIQGEAGVVLGPDGYLRALRELANERGVLLIFDEIQTGIGRTGTLFAFESEGATPDVLTLGKGLGSGVPLSAALVSSRAACLGLGDQGGTYHGNPLMTAVGLAVLATVSRPEFLANVRDLGAELGAGLGELARETGGRARGRGLLWALELERPIAEHARDACLERGLLVNAARPTILRFMPSLRVTSAEIDSMLDVLATVLRLLA